MGDPDRGFARHGRALTVLALHLLLAFGMAAFAGSFSPMGVLFAFFLVYLVFKVGGRMARTGAHARRVERGTVFVFWFVLEVFKASFDVARLVTAWRVDATPGIVPVRLAVQKDWVATLVGMLLTLTPGTMAMEYDSRAGLLYIHVLDAESADTVDAAVRRIETRLLAWLDPAAGAAGEETP
jgi:multicomponent Na+:H+ antiporter subunit E